MERKILARPIAITDVETTGLDPKVQEIVEIGLVVIDQSTLMIIDTLNVKIKPEHIETASEFALKLNGYNSADWEKAISLPEAMALYAEKTKEAMFCAHNVTFDWSFIAESFKKTGVKNEMDYHRLDLFTMAWMKLKNSGLEKLNMNEVAKFLGIPEEPLPHRGINGAMTEYEIYKKLIML
ncbi:MAG: 3'-5' exonuclease [bacterium]|nr:3'-5' exonuclease [bacterium]